MNVITIPKKLAARIDFKPKIVKEVSMTKQQKLALIRARKNLAEGKTMTLHELKRKLGIKNR